MSDPAPYDAARIIEAFGGIRPMAKKLGVAVTTIQGWKERNTIPIRRLDQIRAAAAREGIDLGAPAVPEDDAADGPADDPIADRSASPLPGVAAEEAPAAAGPVEAEPLRAERVSNTPSGVKEAESAAAGPTVEALPEKPAARNRAFAFGAGFAAMLAVGVLIGWAIADRSQGQDPNREAIATLEHRLAAAETAAAQARSVASAAGAQSAALAKRLEAAEAAAAALAGKLDAGSDGAALKALGDSVAAMQTDQETLCRTVAGIRSDGRLEKIAADLAGLETGVAELRKAVAESAGQTAGRDGEEAATQAALSNLSQELATLSEKVAALDPNRLAEAENALSDLAARLSAAESRLNALQTGDSATTGIVVALSQLRAAAASGRPYGTALTVARNLASGNEAAAAILEALEPAAAGGAPVLPVLRREFDALSAGLVAEPAPAQGANWIDRAWNKVKSTIVVRRTGRSVTGDTVSALVARAEVRLADGDLAGAIALVRKMPAAARQSASGWLARAGRRADTDAALARLDALMAMLSGAARGAKAGSQGRGKP